MKRKGKKSNPVTGDHLCESEMGKKEHTAFMYYGWGMEPEMGGKETEPQEAGQESLGQI